MISTTGWLTATLLTFLPISVALICLFVVIDIVHKKVHEHSDNNDSKFVRKFKVKYLAILLLVALSYSGFNSANRPKYDTTPVMTHQQNTFQQKMERAAKQEVKESKKIEDSFDGRREDILEQFNYKEKDQ